MPRVLLANWTRSPIGWGVGAPSAAHVAALGVLAIPAAPPPAPNASDTALTLTLQALAAEPDAATPSAPEPDRAAPTETAPLDAPAPELAAAPITEPIEPEPTPPSPLDSASPETPALERLLDAIADQLPESDPELEPAPPAPSIPTPTGDAPAPPGRRLVFVLDAAGSTAPVFGSMSSHVEHAIAALDHDDRFAITLARDAPGASEAFRRGRLIDASPAAKRDAVQWLRRVRPFGRPDPLAGLAPALRHRPDAIVYLARSIPRTPEAGAVRAPTPGLDHTELLHRLDRLNPRDRHTGRRRTAIHAIQLAEDDPTGLMQSIAHDHGLGDRSYRVLRPRAWSAAKP
ncbi:MAG: hypothetical protein AAGK04_01595 [Planctomycetota bacterium]